MVIPNSGPLTFIIIRDEFAASNPIIFTQYYRGGGIVPDTPENVNIPTSGEIAVGDFYGAVGATVVVIEANRNNVDLSTAPYFGADWTANVPKVLIVNPGVTLGSTSTGAAALSVPSNLAGTLKIKNNGLIAGAGGPGGTTSTSPGANGGSGGAGGLALSVAAPITVENNGTIAGGGGGGGGGGSGNNQNYTIPRTCRRTASGQGCDTCPCPGGYIIQSCNNTGIRCAGGRKRIRTTSCYQDYPCNGTGTYQGGDGAPGGRGQGSDGSATSGGSTRPSGGGGAGNGGAGGPGSNYGLTGSSGSPSSNGGAGGPGGAGGNYVSGNSFVTWDVTGTRLGGAV